jgi:hypothetical protein
MTRRLRDELRKQRRGLPLRLLFVLVLFGIPLAVLAWLVWPRPAPPPLAVVAFDACVPLGADAPLHAEVVRDDDNQAIDQRVELVFDEVKAVPGKKADPIRTITSERGTAHAILSARATDTVVEYVALCAGTEKRRRANDRARVYFLPERASLLLVAVETLTDASAKDWQQRNLLDIQPMADAGAALRGRAGKEERVVYLALGAVDAWQYRRMRNWLTTKVSQGVLPPGPVLGRSAYGTPQQTDVEIMALKKTFTGAMTAVVGDAAAAAVLQKAGVETIQIGKGHAAWKDWAKKS